MHLFGYHDSFHHHDTVSYLHVHQHIRVVVMGAASVGKTSIIQQALYHHFPDRYKETIEDTFLYKGDNCDLEIIDTSGSHNFPDMMKIAIMAADVFILVFSVADWSTFDRITALRQQILQLRSDDIHIIVVGNKTDVVEREIQPEVAESIASIDWHCKYHDVCAKNVENCCDVFNDVIGCFPNLYGEKLKKQVEREEILLPARRVQKHSHSHKLRSSIQSFVKKVQNNVSQILE